jgi:hypothetical protein
MPRRGIEGSGWDFVGGEAAVEEEIWRVCSRISASRWNFPRHFDVPRLSTDGDMY